MRIKRCPLSKRIPRELTANWGRYLGMVVILVCTIALGSSFQSTLDGTICYLDDIEDGNFLEDGYFETAEEIAGKEDDFYRENGIELYENFYATEKKFLDDAKVIIFNERTRIDVPTVFAGELPKEKNEIALDHVFARGRDIAIGDTVTMLGQKFKVCGTVSLPDYTSLFLNNTDLVMNTMHFGAAVVSKETFGDFPKDNLTCRYSYRFRERDLSKARKLALAEDMQKHLAGSGEALQAFLPADQNQSITFLKMDIGKDGPFMQVFVYMLIALIAFVFAILTNNTIEKESVIIGTLLASGYRKREIIWHYLQPTLIVAVAGSVIGNAIGYTVMIEPFLDLYYTTYSVGPIQPQFSVPAFLMTTVLPVVIMFAIGCLMLMRKLSLTPLKFLRRDLKKKKQKKALKLPDFKFLTRFRLRVILQNKASYFMLFLGVFLASFLLMFGLGLNPLMEHYTQKVDETLPFDYQYLLKAPVETDKGEKAYVYEMDCWFALGGKDIGVSLMGIDKDSICFEGAADQGISISSALSNKMNLDAGDTIVLKDTVKEKEYELKIEAVYDYDVGMAMFMDRGELNDLLGNETGAYNCIFSREKVDIEEKYLAKEITRADLLGAADQMMDSFDVIIQFVNLFSVIVYMILMYILTKVVIDKNALSISFMKVFGYDQKEIRKLYLTATTIVVALSLLVCIPIEILTFKIVLVFLSSMVEGYLEFYLPARVYAEIVVIGLAAYFIINALHIRGIRRIPMTEALKNRE